MILFGGSNEPFNLANLFPFFSIQLFGQLLRLSQLQSLLLYIFTIYLIGLYSIDKFLNSEFPKNHNINILLSIIYIFSPYFLSFYPPGHLTILPLFFLFPLCIYYIKQYSFKKRKIYIVYLYLIFIFLASSIANVSYLFIFIILINLGALIYINNIKNINGRINLHLKINFLLLFANFWWILPTFFYFLNNLVNQVNFSNQHLGASIIFAARNLSINNIIFSNFDKQNYLNYKFYNIYSNLINYSYFILLIFSLLPFFFKKNNIKILFILFFLLISIFFLKAMNPPYNNFFLYLYKNIGIMQILRRPQSKLYWFFILCLINLVAYFQTINYFKINRLLIFIIAIFFVSLYMFSKQLLLPYNIPFDYQSVKNYFEKKQDIKILVLPKLDFQLIKYNKSVNEIGGVDFLRYYLMKTQISDDLYLDIILNNNLKLKITDLLNKIYSKKSNTVEYCDLLSQLDISNIIVRKNLQNKTVNLNLKNNILFKNIITGPNIELFEVSKSCKKNNYFNNEKLIINLPYLKFYDLYKTIYKKEFNFSQNFDKNWLLLIYNSNETISKNILNNLFLYKKSTINHKVYLGYANQWIIDSKTLNLKFDKIILIHISQIYFVLGIIVFLLHSILLFFDYLY